MKGCRKPKLSPTESEQLSVFCHTQNTVLTQLSRSAY